MLDSQVNDKSKTGVGYHAIPPPYTRNFMPLKLDLILADVNEYVVSEFVTSVPVVATNKVKTSESKPKSIQVCNGLGLQESLIILLYMEGNPQFELQEKGVINSGCSRHMTKNMFYLSKYEEINGGYVAFGGDPKGGKITGKGKISISKLDFKDVYFVKELKFNLFSVSQMCDKKNSVLFTDTEYVVLSFDFKLLDESQVLLRVPRKNNMYIVDLKNIAPSGGLTCLFAKATLDESNHWNRRLGHINFKNMNKLKEKQHKASCKTKTISTAKQVNIAYPRPTVNSARLVSNVFNKAHSHDKRPINNRTTSKNNKINQNVNTIRAKHVNTVRPKVNTARPKAVLNVIQGNQEKGVIDSGCSRHMTRNMSYLSEYEEIDGGYVDFRGDPKGGKITGIENLIDHKVKIIRCDNGTEFKNKEMNQLCEKQGKARVEIVPDKDYILLPLWTKDLLFSSSSKDSPSGGFKPSGEEEKKDTEVNVFGRKSSIGFPDDPNMPDLEDISIFEDSNEDVFGVEADLNNMETTFQVSPIPNTRIHKHHPVEQIIRDIHSAPQTRWMTKNVIDHEPKKQVWTLMDLPYGKRAIETNWIYINNKDERGIVVRNKARLVAQGYTQEERIDYDEVFDLVARIEAIRMFLAHASFKEFVVYQMDVKSAFLYGKIKKEVYICQHLGFEDPKFPDKVYKVEKALYGLHQAPRAWYETFYLFIRQWISERKEMCKEFEKMMHKKFQMSSTGKLTFFLELQVTQKDDGILISQDKYVDEILKKFGSSTVKTPSTPIETSKPSMKDENAKDIDVHLYRSMIGSLMYLTSSRPDIIFAVCACARFQVTPKVLHLHAAKRIFRYLKGQPKLGLWYPKDSPFTLEAYADNDYAGASLDRKSTTGGCQFLESRLISWQCKKQTVVANSTTEAEYVAASNCWERALGYMVQIRLVRFCLKEPKGI
nr:hypothetical protein [Tanacetum cinerariifolium]